MELAAFVSIACGIYGSLKFICSALIEPSLFVVQRSLIELHVIKDALI